MPLPTDPLQNHLLSALPEAEWARWHPQLEEVKLELGVAVGVAVGDTLKVGLTLGVKPDVDWDEYRAECELIETRMKLLGQQLSEGLLSYDTVKRTVEQLLIAHNPWRFVNVLPVAREQLVDLSAGGIHHSWEEDPVQAPLGNVLYEIQAEAMDNVSTFRSFDKGKIASDGVVRPVQIEEYFRAIDRSSEANDPLPHLRSPEVARRTDEYLHEHLLASRYYRLDKLTLHQLGDRYTERINGFRHLFAKCGSLEVKSGSTSVMVSSGHSCFVPAAAESIEVVSRSPETEVLVTS
jgi:mannose-6-phosphate isomerase class I